MGKLKSADIKFKRKSNNITACEGAIFLAWGFHDLLPRLLTI